MTTGSDYSRREGIRKPDNRFRGLSALVLLLTLSPLVSCMPPPVSTPLVIVSATFTPPASGTPAASETAMPAATAEPGPISFTFIADADAWVDEASPNENNGSADTLRADGEGDGSAESLIRFTVSGLSGYVSSAQLRIYAATGSRNGPMVYLTDPAWEEADITWNTRPERKTGALDNKDRVQGETWVEYNVTPQVTQDGFYSFALVADSGDGLDFSSREGSYPPRLLITTGDATPTASPTVPASAEVFVGAGDIALCDDQNAELTAQLLDTIPGTVFTTGDNAYDDGTYTQFAECYGPTWGRHKDRTRPVPGNHEYHTPDAAGYFQYFDEIPEYYAYDLGSWRIYALNSEIDVSAASPQVDWLQADLAANPRRCVLAYWHRPRWSSGSTHGNDRSYQTLWEILYRAGAEVVLNGHEHNYERFAPMNAGGGRDPLGMREFVVGMGGRGFYDFGPPLPTSEVRDNTSYGVLKLTLHDTGYGWQFIPAAGYTFTDSGSADCH